ncbi:Anthranilate phosphoribosyltransferase 2 [compost metagenome]
MISQVLLQLMEGQSLTRLDAAALMDRVFAGEATPAQVAAVLTALKLKGETPEEVAGFADAMRAHALAFPLVGEGIDTCGTGGDRAGTFNLSTTVAFLAAGAGLKVAKHGGRSASSKTGGADVLEALGVDIEMSPDTAARCLDRHGVTFLFAPRYHPAMRHVAPVRRELGIPTVFNVLGPLCNPSKPLRQVLGVYRPELVDLVSQALLELGSTHAMVVHGLSGLDELTLDGPTLVAELKDGGIRRYEVHPRDVGLAEAPISALAGGDALSNARIIQDLLSGIERGPRRDAALLNAAAALQVGGLAATLQEGVALARESLDSGRALDKLNCLVKESKLS